VGVRDCLLAGQRVDHLPQSSEDAGVFAGPQPVRSAATSAMTVQNSFQGSDGVCGVW